MFFCVVFSQSGTRRHGEQPPLHSRRPSPRNLRCRQPGAAVEHSHREERDGELWPCVQHGEESRADDHRPLLQPPRPLRPQQQQCGGLWPLQGHPPQYAQRPLQLCQLLRLPPGLAVSVQRRRRPEYFGVGARQWNGRLRWAFEGREQGQSERQEGGETEHCHSGRMEQWWGWPVMVSVMRMTRDGQRDEDDPWWSAWCWCCLLLPHSVLVPPQTVSPVVWMKVLGFTRSSMLPHSCACSVAPWGHCCLLTSLKRGQNCRMCSGDCGPVWLLWRGDRTIERALETVVLSGLGSVQYAPALVGWESTTFFTKVCSLSHFGSWANPGFGNDRVAQRLKAWKSQKAGRTHRVHTKKILLKFTNCSQICNMAWISNT